MSLVKPSPLATDEAKRLLRAMSFGRQVYSLYQQDHPKRQEAAKDILESLRRLHRALGQEAVLFIGRGGFYLGPTLLPRASLTFYRLLEAFEQADIEAVEVVPAVTEADVDAFVQVLTKQKLHSAPLGGISLNSVRPWFGGDDGDRGMKELLRRYAEGVDLMRDTAARVAAGQPANIEAVGRFTSRLADQVAGDPTQALLLSTVKSYDEYTYYHMVNVCILSLAIGQAIELRQDQVAALGVGGLLHDVGKVKVPRDVLQQAGPLSEEQWRLIQRHPVEGAGVLLTSAKDVFHPALTMVLEHHSAYDASGYPALPGARQPSLPARIVSVADCFDAVTSKRPYRKPEERRQALSILQSGAGRGYDPRVVRTFVRLLGLFPIGSLVRLTTQATGVVVRNHEHLLARPTVRMLLDAGGSPCEPEELDLSERGNDGGHRWSIERSVDPAELGMDMLSLLSSGQLESERESDDEGPGLVHEPAHGETPPPNYVDTHNHTQARTA
jgi:HD-GYP domain-containing protein (c-di-GMP phosphodiesterase class II)